MLMPAFLFDSADKGLFIFLGLSLVLGGAAAFSLGRALAQNWRPLWQAPAYCLLLAAAIRFLHYALFDQRLLSLQGYALDFLAAAGFAWLGFKLTRARQMKQNYGWIDAERNEQQRKPI
jgi:hypothetical protein